MHKNNLLSVPHASPYVKGEPLVSRRLDKNATAVDVLQSNRDIWYAGGGPDIESLASPTEPMIDHCNRTVTVLHAMLLKHGAQGGLDSHVEDITNAVPGLSLHILVQQHARSFACLSDAPAQGETVESRVVGSNQEGSLLRDTLCNLRRVGAECAETPKPLE